MVTCDPSCDPFFMKDKAESTDSWLTRIEFYPASSWCIRFIKVALVVLFASLMPKAQL